MGQEVKNLLRAQSKYGLMGSSAKRGKKISAGHRSSFWIKLSFGIGHPQLYINCSVYVWGRAQGSQIFKLNSIILIRSKVMAFLVILLSPHGPHVIPIVPVIPMSSPLSPCHPPTSPFIDPPARGHVQTCTLGPPHIGTHHLEPAGKQTFSLRLKDLLVYRTA